MLAGQATLGALLTAGNETIPLPQGGEPSYLVREEGGSETVCGWAAASRLSKHLEVM
jgi:hypothetical protein